MWENEQLCLCFINIILLEITRQMNLFNDVFIPGNILFNYRMSNEDRDEQQPMYA